MLITDSPRIPDADEDLSAQGSDDATRAVDGGTHTEKEGGDRSSPPDIDPHDPAEKADEDRAIDPHDPAEKADEDRAFPTPRKVPTLWAVVYLAGEIHTDWRHEVTEAATELPIRFTYPVLDHSASDHCGVTILGPETKDHWRDHKGAKINAIRTRTLINEADIVVARFDGSSTFRQWNAAFEAGQAVALGKSLIVMHGEKSGHALKEVDAAALAVAENATQVADILRYIVTGKLPKPPKG